MPTGSGPCRFGQYYIFMEDLIKRLEIPDVAVFALTSENSYVGMEDGFERKGWWAVIVADAMEDIRAMLLANAVLALVAIGVWHGAMRGIGALPIDWPRGVFRILHGLVLATTIAVGFASYVGCLRWLRMPGAEELWELPRKLLRRLTGR